MAKLKEYLVFLFLVNVSAGDFSKNAGAEITIKVNQEIPKHLCWRFLNNLEFLINSSSDVLEHETSSPLSSVTVELPESMVSSACSANISLARLGVDTLKSDVVITERDPVFGTAAFGVQAEGCGARGRRVYLASDRLLQADNLTSDTVLQFSSSLVSHLYGVFPSHGYKNDSMYPATYTVAEVVLDNLDCRPHQSLFCSPHSYPHSAPTKQNLLCGEKSPLEIVTGAPTPTNSLQSPQPSRVIRYVSHVATRYVLLLDRSERMGRHGRWNNMHNALFGFITQLAPGDELAIVTFSKTSRINLEPTRVSKTNKEGLAGRVPGRATNSNSSCYSCGLKTAQDLLSSSATVMTVVIAVRVEDADSEQRQGVEKVLEKTRTPLYELIVGGEFVNRKEKSEGKFYVLSDGTDQQTEFSDVFLAISNDVNDDNDGYAKFYENKLRNDGGAKIEGKFSVEESLRTELKVVLNTHNKEDIEKFQLVSPSGRHHKFPFVERGSVYFQFDSSAESGIWTYSISRLMESSLTVSAYAKKTGPNTLSLKTWTSLSGSNSLAQLSSPVMVYGELRSGQVPVSGAEVVAVITRPDGRSVRLVLTDSGTGYPDITAGDGIYSGYFTSYCDTPGTYSLVVTARDMSASARVPTLSYSLASDCCGSTYPSLNTIPTPPFTRIVTGQSFQVAVGAQYLIQNGTPQMRDVFPPVRVTDLAVSHITNTSLQLSLAWSAPGDDLMEGRAAYYKLKCSANRTNLVLDFAGTLNTAVSDVPTPALAGSRQTAEVLLEAANTLYYCGLVTGDEAGNEAPTSNLVAVFLRQEAEQADDESQDWVDAGLYTGNKDGGLDNMLIYIITGGGIIIVIILIFVIICITHKPKKEKKNKPPMITEISGPTLIHSSSALPGILKDSNNLSVLPPNTNDYSLDYSPNKSERSPNSGVTDLSWAILPSYSNVAFKKSSETIVDSGFYRAGEAVDNVYEFYQPSAEYAIYQQVNKEKKFEDISDNGTATTDCEISDTHSDKIIRHQHPHISPDFHSLVVTSEDFRKPSVEMEQGPISLPHYTNFEDFAERRRRRESFV